MPSKHGLELSLSLFLLLLLAGGSASVYGQSKPKMYLEMSEAEQQAFIAKTAESISYQFGNRKGFSIGEKITPQAVAVIKPLVDAYAKRVKGTKEKLWSESLSTVLKRWWQNETIIATAFEAERQEPNNWWFSSRLGVYMAMIESEF